jgi:hypothetical protein
VAGDPAGASVRIVVISRGVSTPSGAEVAPVPPRQPCPCGSGRRYKACHGARSSLPSRPRPFAGRPEEAVLVALREVVPSATAPLRLPTLADRDVTLGTVLPVGWAAMVRRDGRIVVSLQVPARSGDLDRDLGQALLAACDAEPGRGIASMPVPGPGPRLSELMGPEPLDVTLHAGFDWWLDGTPTLEPDVAAALEDANAKVVPTERVEGAESAFWCRIGEREHLRWALPDDEEPLLDALARVSLRSGLGLGAGTRYVGAFRALGLLMPVWDLAAGTGSAALAAPVAGLRGALDRELAEPRGLTDEERRLRSGLVGRQLFLR